MRRAHSPGRRRLALLGALAAVAVLPAATAQASGATSALCTARFMATVSPGFTFNPSSGTVSGHGSDGSLICTGTVDGDRVTAPGSIQVDYAYEGATCLGHVGIGTAHWNIPTIAGVKHLVGSLVVRRTALVILAEVRFPGASANPIGAVVPVVGNCVLTPLQGVLVSVSGLLSS